MNTDKVLTVEYPRHIEIRTKEEAAHAILHMCDHCVYQTNCSGARSIQCNITKQRIKKFATEEL